MELSAAILPALGGFALHFLFQKYEKTHLNQLFSAGIQVQLPVHTDRRLFGLLYDALRVHSFLSAVEPAPTSEAPRTNSCKMYEVLGVVPNTYRKISRQIVGTASTVWVNSQNRTPFTTGPNELSICDVSAIQPVLGNDGMGKGPMWEARQSARKKKTGSLVGIRDVAYHLRRRKPWNKALSTAGVKAYEPILRARLVQLVEIFDGKASRKEAVDLAEWLSFFSYDFMGDMA
ncbi:hypothetical protein AAF712_015448 [Marasmius tenuissimus]|uniref:Cytochrome P450 n=1 Tax=Marasmius tenuissimus TaxID=585030 RepID=A0ABR2ZAD7_9AGAR